MFGVWIGVTTNPTAEWVARQITEAFPWDGAPRYMIRDRGRIYGTVVTRRPRAMGIRDKPIAPASPWQNWLCRTADRIDPARVFGPHHCPGRGTSASDSEKLCGLLQRRENASVIEQRCACLSPGSAIRRHKFARHTGRTSSSIRSDLDFRYTQASLPVRHKSCCRAIKARATKRSIAFLFAEAGSFRHIGIFSVLGAASIEASACLSFGTIGTRPWPRWKRLPSSSFLSRWVLALLR
jgi:hypothetical protein